LVARFDAVAAARDRDADPSESAFEVPAARATALVLARERLVFEVELWAAFAAGFFDREGDNV
jgi:hypothetical protein